MLSKVNRPGKDKPYDVIIRPAMTDIEMNVPTELPRFVKKKTNRARVMRLR